MLPIRHTILQIHFNIVYRYCKGEKSDCSGTFLLVILLLVVGCISWDTGSRQQEVRYNRAHPLDGFYL